MGFVTIWWYIEGLKESGAQYQTNYHVELWSMEWVGCTNSQLLLKDGTYITCNMECWFCPSWWKRKDRLIINLWILYVSGIKVHVSGGFFLFFYVLFHVPMISKSGEFTYNKWVQGSKIVYFYLFISLCSPQVLYAYCPHIRLVQWRTMLKVKMTCQI